MLPVTKSALEACGDDLKSQYVTYQEMMLVELCILPNVGKIKLIKVATAEMFWYLIVSNFRRGKK
jgi:hypothetical protein